MLPGMLRWFDEADLAAALAPKPLFLTCVSNEHGNRLSSDQLNERFVWSKTRYSGPQEAGALRLVPGDPARQSSVQSLLQWLKNRRFNIPRE